MCQGIISDEFCLTSHTLSKFSDTTNMNALNLGTPSGHMCASVCAKGEEGASVCVKGEESVSVFVKRVAIVKPYAAEESDLSTCCEYALMLRSCGQHWLHGQLYGEG